MRRTVGVCIILLVLGLAFPPVSGLSQPNLDLYLPLVRQNAQKNSILYDSFSGAGAFTAHSAEIHPAGSSWEVISGTFGDLNGGYLPYGNGNLGQAVIDIGVSDFELVFRSKLVDTTLPHSGVLFRSPMGGGIGNYYSADMRINPTGDPLIAVSLPGSVLFDPINQPGSSSHTFSGAAGDYYTWRVILRGSQWRLLDSRGTVMIAGLSAARNSNDYIGLLNESGEGAAAWDHIQATTLTTPWKPFSVLGDSISDEDGEWAGIVSVKYGNHLNLLLNHADSGSSVKFNLDDQIDQAEADQADFTIIALGTNDYNYTDFAAKYQENLIELWNTLGKPIYAMGVLPKSFNINREANNNSIEAAVAGAQAAGVNVTYWNTDGWIDPTSDTTDGLHPNSSGQDKIAARVLELLP